MQKQKSETELVGAILKALQETNKTPKEIAAELGTTHQKITAVKRAHLSDGLGDKVEKLTTATGIKKVVEAFTPEGKDCGCEERKNRLNEIMPRKVIANCLTQTEYEFLKDFFAKFGWKYTPDSATNKRLHEIRARVFGLRLHVPTCSKCLLNNYRELQRLLQAYA